MESSILSEVDDTSILRTSAPGARAVLSTGYQPLTSCPRAAGWSAATLCIGQNLTGVRRVAGNRPGSGEELIRFGPTDFTTVARSFGVRGIRVERAAEIAPALAEAVHASEPVVVDVVTDLEPRAPEPWAPAQR